MTLHLPEGLLDQEFTEAQSRRLELERLFVILLGPSGVGKSAVMGALDNSSSFTFRYINPVMTRPNRPGETDKVSVSDAVFAEMEANGEFAAVNHLYATSYGTPLAPIEAAQSEGEIPLLDYPLDGVDRLRRLDKYDLLSFYIYPPSIRQLYGRLQGADRLEGGRFERGVEEIGVLATLGYKDPDIDFSVINHEREEATVAAFISHAIATVTMRE